MFGVLCKVFQRDHPACWEEHALVLLLEIRWRRKLRGKSSEVPLSCSSSSSMQMTSVGSDEICGRRLRVGRLVSDSSYTPAFLLLMHDLKLERIDSTEEEDGMFPLLPLPDEWGIGPCAWAVQFELEPGPPPPASLASAFFCIECTEDTPFLMSSSLR